MTGFIDRMAARARSTPDPAVPALHLRPLSRFEPDPATAAAPDPAAPGLVRAPGLPSDPPPYHPDPPVRLAIPEPTARQRPPAPGPVEPESRGPATDSVARPEPPTPSASGWRLPWEHPINGEARHRDAGGQGHEADPEAQDVETMDPLDAVRRHVVPRLVANGVLTAANEVEVVGPDDHPPVRRPGRPGVRLRVDLDDPAPGPARPSASAARTSSIAQRGGVQVNIGRIEVVRQGAPAPATARPAAPPRPDPAAGHAAYLARRRELS